MLTLRTTLIALAVSGFVAGPAAAKEVCYFGVCKDVPVAPAAPAPAPKPATAPTTTSDSDGELKVLASYGSWQVVADAQGHRAVVDTFDDGSKLLLMSVGDEFEILIREPTWRLNDGHTLAVKVDIDGATFDGTSTVVDGQTVAIRHLTEKFVKALFGGDRARVEIGDDSWTVSLTDAAAAIDAAKKADKTTTS